MGKRIGSIIALLIATLVTVAAHSNALSQVQLSRQNASIIGSLTTQAQEIPAYPRTVALSTQFIVGDDALREQVVIFKSTQEEPSSDKHLLVWTTAYTSDPAETDDTPFITASGSLVRDGVAAANFLPLGTEFRLPEQFGDKVFTVEDRMNARYNNEHIVDIWFPEKSQAKTFGKRMLTLEIL